MTSQPQRCIVWDSAVAALLTPWLAVGAISSPNRAPVAGLIRSLAMAATNAAVNNQTIEYIETRMANKTGALPLLRQPHDSSSRLPSVCLRLGQPYSPGSRSPAWPAELSNATTPVSAAKHHSVLCGQTRSPRTLAGSKEEPGAAGKKSRTISSRICRASFVLRSPSAFSVFTSLWHESSPAWMRIISVPQVTQGEIITNTGPQKISSSVALNVPVTHMHNTHTHTIR